MINKNKVIPLELLAPARDLETGRLALANGADAVYIGASRFGARQAAGNSWKDIQALAKQAHFFGARVYVVLNTIFFNEEAPALQDALDQAGNSGVDALILQDPGIFELRLPALPIFISTQAHNVKVEKILFWEKLGCQRVILGRELSLAEIKAISSQVKIELETFIHGALCVSYSGRCYLSQQICGRSANRGACVQACRLPYRLVDAEGKLIGGGEKPWLSLKDFNASAFISSLAAAGITSFKIEGRLKDDVYVANTTAAYRLLLDKIIVQSDGLYRRASYGRIDLAYQPDLNKSFNRGYTDYFLSGQRRDWLAAGSASLGEAIGIITASRNGVYQLDRKHDLRPGDGLVFVRANKIFAGAYVNQSGSWIKLNKHLDLRLGDEVFRNENPAFERTVRSGASRRLATSWEIEFTADAVELKVSAENGAHVKLSKKGCWSPAQNKELAADNLKKQLFKLGQSGFYGQDFKLIGENPFFIPLAEINSWRREITEKLIIASEDVYQPLPVNKIKKEKQAYPKKELDYRHNIASDYARNFYERHGAFVGEEAIEKSGLTADHPLMTTKYCLRYALGACPKQAQAKKLNEPLFLEKQDQRYRLHFDCQHCLMELLSDR